ncbi:MAG: LuxR C-terminal-related transcriptional regulator [Thermomicrobiales bacterium]
MDTPGVASVLGSLPVLRGRLIGREETIATSLHLLLDEAVPLLTLSGPGGVGKTSLALAVAREAARQFADGVIWVDLAPIADPDLVTTAVVTSLALPASAGQALDEVIAVHLRTRQALLLIDNCEHLLAAAADLVAMLLPICPAVQVLATSRSPLRVRGEHVLPVDPLALPAASAAGWADVASADAVQLFVQRARAVRPGFTVNEGNAAAVAALSRALDGLPLAIELAAARSSLFPPEELLARMGDRFGLLRGGPRDLPMRQRTLWHAIAWSYDLLPSAAQTMFRFLAVFAGGFTLPAAQAVAPAAGLDPDAIVEILQILVDHGLVRSMDSLGHARWTMLETVREFAWQALGETSETDRARDAHADVFVALVDDAEPRIHGPAARHWQAILDVERDNIRTALVWLEAQRDGERMLRLAIIGDHWLARGQVPEARSWLERALRLEGSPLARQHALFWGSVIAGLQGDGEQAESWANEGLILCDRSGDRRFEGRLLYALAQTAWVSGDLPLAIARGEHAVARLRHADDPVWLAYALGDLGTALVRQGQVETGTQVFEEGLALHRSLGNASGMGIQSHDMAAALRSSGAGAAIRYYRESLRLVWELGNTMWLAEPLAGIAHLAAQTGNPVWAARLLGTAERLREQSGADTRTPEQRAALVHAENWVRHALGDDAFIAERDAGRAIPTDQAIVEALALSAAWADRENWPDGPLSVDDAVSLSPLAAESGLTRREREVLRLLCQRLTDPEIAAHLYISPRTAGHHVSSILAKLAVSSRREAAAAAVRLGLI